MVRACFPEGNPLGRTLVYDNVAWEIVGVVGNIRHGGPEKAPWHEAYIPFAQEKVVQATLVMRTDGDPAALLPAVKAAIWSVDRTRPIERVATMSEVVAASAAVRRFAMLVLQVFALVSLLLAATGIYGMFSGRVTERLREIGVRAALGASPRAIVAMVVRQGLVLIGLGAAAGVLGAVLASRVLVTLLFSVSRLDPLTYAAVIGMLAVVSSIACGVPAWRATRVDPTVTLRAG
jgi:predicted lysophospholipase L1 biosynthesis ABC-type transport system permease subunit